MRVLTVGNRTPDPSAGGYEVVWTDLLEGLRAAGHDAVALHPPELPGYWQDGAWLRPSPWRAWRVDCRSRSVLREHLAHADVVVWMNVGGLAMSLLREADRAGVAQVGLVHDGWMRYGPRYDRWHAFLRRRFRPSATTLWCANSRFIAEGLIAEVGLRRVEVVPPGVDRRLFAPSPARVAWQGRLLCVGRLNEDKGTHHAVQALAHLPEATLVVHGPHDADAMSWLERVAEEAGVRDRLRLGGPLAREDVRAAYAAADAVLFPVVWPEPWGLVPLEAMAVGRPVVATGTGGSGEYLRDAENALLVAPRDPRAIAAAVRRLAGDEALRERLVRGGSRTAAEHDQAAFVARQVALIEAEVARD